MKTTQMEEKVYNDVDITTTLDVVPLMLLGKKVTCLVECWCPAGADLQSSVDNETSG